MNSSGPPPAQSGCNILQGYQSIDFSSPDAEDSWEVVASEVIVVPSAGDHDSGSSKVKVHNVVDYTWEERFYTGQLLAVHMGGVYIAYGIKAANKTAGVVRVTNRRDDLRTLIKGMESAVQDIAFAHIPQEILLACVDLKGNLFIHKVVEEASSPPRIYCQLHLHILPDPLYILQPGDFYRVIWCPFIPELPDDSLDSQENMSQDPTEDVAQLLALSRGKKVELWNIKMVSERHGAGPVQPGMVEMGYLEIIEHTKPIVDASFAPDGTAIATASLDGEIKFFQVYMQNGKKPRCLHQWQPHGGQPLSSLFFLDNHKNYNPNIQFWKFAITGANNNSELRVWSCESWICLQTLSFQARPDRPIKLNACLDLASGYLVLSDFHHRVLYVLELYTNSNETSAAIISISEFLLPYPILSFGIVDAGMRCLNAKNLVEVSNVPSDENDEENAMGVVIQMYLVQPKSLQDCQIAFIPPKPNSVDRSQLMIQDSLLFRDTLSDMSVNLSNGDLSTSNPNLQELPANHSSLQLNLMTPDAFNSPVKHETSGSSLIKSSHVDEASYSNTTTLVASPHSPDETDNSLLPGIVDSNIKCYAFASGGSSPSREVQEILGEGKCFYRESDDIQQDQEQVELTPPEEKPVSAVWSEIPMLRATEVIKNEEQARKSVNLGESSVAVDNDIWKLNQRLETSISSMIHVMNSMLQTCEEQANERKQLRKEQQTMLREINNIVSHNSQQQTILLEKILDIIQDKQRQEALAVAVSQSVISFLSTKFVDSVNNEISTTVVPAVINQMESLKHQIHVELTQKLSTTDHLLKESITKLVNSQSVMDVLSAAAVSSLTPAISQCYKEYFTNVALPSFEKSCSTMFSQINETFSKGSKEFMSSLDSQSRRLSDKNREQNAQLQALSEVLKSSTAQMNNDMKKSVASIEKQVMDAVTRALTLQQATLEGSVIAAVRSRAVTPAPHVLDTQLQQTQILQLISQGQVNSAFQQALSASDLNLVVFICEKVNPQQLFSQVPCPLQQHVLLSLVQQLSADMNNHTEIKHKYLEEALMNLDANNSVTREHLPVVLNNLQRQLQAYITSNPNNRITRSMKLLLMASQAVYNNSLTNSH